MHWKMSIDLSRPLVPGMGHHDPLDGLLTFHEVQTLAAAEGGPGEPENLADEIIALARMCKGRDWLTDDPLGLGGLLSDALRAVRLMAANPALQLDGLLADLLDAGAKGLSFSGSRSTLHKTAPYRLAFRELGLAIGLHAAERIDHAVQEKPRALCKAKQLCAPPAGDSSTTNRSATRSKSSGSAPNTRGRKLDRTSGHQHGDARHQP